MNTDERQMKKAGGLQISFINACLLSVTGLLALCLFLISGDVRKAYDRASLGMNEYIRLEQQAVIVQDASDYLTNEVRLFVETGYLKHARNYFEESNVTRRREAALAALAEQDAVSPENMNKAVAESRELMKREIYAMALGCSAYGYAESAIPQEVREITLSAEDAALSPAAKIAKARGLVFDEEYQGAKTRIYGALELFAGEVLEKTEADFLQGNQEVKQLLVVQRVLLGVLVAMVILISLAILLLVSRPLRTYLECFRNQTLLLPCGAYEFQYLAQVYNDIYTQNKEGEIRQRMLRHKAEHDQMTGLRNRASAESLVRDLMAGDGKRGILALVDLDDLKGINDTLGHKAGDAAILGLSRSLKGQFRDSDVVARIGGDEFLVFLPGAAERQDAIAQSIAAMQKKMAEIRVGPHGERALHCSIGCAVETEETLSYEELFKQADLALYHVKRNGKNGFAFFSQEMRESD